MKHKGLFLLVLFFLHSVLFSAYNDEIMNQIVDELRDKTVLEILQKEQYKDTMSIKIIEYINKKEDLDKEMCIKLLLRCNLNNKKYEDYINKYKEQIITHLRALSLENILNMQYVFNKKVSEMIIKYINEKKDSDEAQCIQLLFNCHSEAEGYGDCIERNKKEIINQLSGMSLANILNIRYFFNKKLSKLIINYINTIKEKDKEPYIKLLLKCYPEAEGYGKCIEDNAKELVNNLFDVSLENILIFKGYFRKDISKQIINHINKEKDGVKKNKLIILLLRCNPDADGYEDCINKNKDELVNKLSDVSLENILDIPYLFNRKVSEEIVNYMIKHSKNNKFKKNFNLLLNLNLEGANEDTMNNYTQLLAKRWKNSKELDKMVNLYNKNKSKNTHSKKDTRDIMYFVLKNKINWGIDFIQVFSTGLIGVGGAGLAASHWINIECLKEPSSRKLLKGVFAIGCIGIASVIYHNRKQKQLIIKEINRNRGIV